MAHRSSYSAPQPRSYRPRVSTYWWLHRWAHFRFFLREFSSVPVAFFIVVTLLQISALVEGPESYAQLETRLQSPVWILLSAVSFLFVVFHTITWFNLTPRAIVVRVRGRRLPDPLVAAPNYVAWLVISGVVAWFVLGK